MAKKTLSLRLSQEGVDDMIRRLSVLESSIQIACEDITKEITTTGETIAMFFDSAAPNTGNNNYSFTSDTYGSENKGYIAMTGPDSLYVEFGTGDVGASSPHPLHNATPGIVPYNSGPTIRIDSEGHYWYAPPGIGSDYYDADGFTRGIPAGCQMYNTLNELKNIAPNIAKKHIAKIINSKIIQ